MKVLRGWIYVSKKASVDIAGAFSHFDCWSQTGTFSHSCLLWKCILSERLEKDFLQSEGFTMLKVMQVVFQPV